MKTTIINKTVSEQIYNSIKEEIIYGSFKPGERIVIESLANMFKVSITPVRDAMQALVSAGYIEKDRNGSFFVLKLSEKDVEDLYDIRESLEGLAVKLVCEKLLKTSSVIDLLESWMKKFKRKKNELLAKDIYIPHELDIKFHDFIIDLCPNNRLKKQISRIMNQTYKLRKLQHDNKISEYKNDKISSRLLIEIEEHIDIIEKILRGNSEEAEKAMRKHIANSREDLLAYVKFTEFKNKT